MYRLRILLVLAAFALLMHGCNSLTLTSDASDTPQPMTLAALENRGPDGNPYLELTDVLPLEWEMVYMERSSSSEWDWVVVPAVPADGEYARNELTAWMESEDEQSEDAPLPERYRVLLKFDDAQSVEEVLLGLERETFSGIVVNGLEPLGSKEERELDRLYPGKNSRHAILFSVGRRPPSAFLGILSLLGAIGCVAGAVFIGRDSDDGRRERRPPKRPSRRGRDRSREPVEEAPIAPSRRPRGASERRRAPRRRRR